MKPIALACAFAVMLCGAYVALGGATYKPLEAADPCDPREQPADDERGVLEKIVVSALDGAACELRVTREDLTLAILEPDARASFLDRNNLSSDELEALVEAGLDRAVDDAVARDELGSFEAGLLREAVGVLPVSEVVDIVRSSAGQSVIGVIRDLLEAT